MSAPAISRTVRRGSSRRTASAGVPIGPTAGCGLNTPRRHVLGLITDEGQPTPYHPGEYPQARPRAGRYQRQVPTLPSIPAATDPAAPALEFPRTTPVRVLVAGDHALVRIGRPQLLEQDGLSVVDVDTAQSDWCRMHRTRA